MGGRMPGIEIAMDREDTEKGEEGEGHPRTQCTLFFEHKESPKGKENEEKEEESLMREWEVKIA
jgi:hypothetical protein